MIDKRINKKGYSVRENKVALCWAKKIMLVRENGGECKNCKEKNIFVLDFHHVSGKKDKDLTIIINNGSLNDAREEVKKCIILCRNCHQQIHVGDRKWGANRKVLLLDALGINSCQKCGFKGENNACLDFHHLDPENKKFSFSDYFNKPSSLELDYINTKEKIEDEAKKCEVLCRNCHALLHIKEERFDRLRDYIDHKIKNYVGKKSFDGELLKKMHIEEKMTASEIAKKMDLCFSTVHHYLKKNGGLKYFGKPGLAVYWKNKKENMERNEKDNP